MQVQGYPGLKDKFNVSLGYETNSKAILGHLAIPCHRIKAKKGLECAQWQNNCLVSEFWVQSEED